MSSYFLYCDALFIAKYTDKYELRNDIIDTIELNCLKKECKDNIGKEKFKNNMDELKFTSDLIFWKLVKEKFGYYYKTY